jgi:hypothetical protein
MNGPNADVEVTMVSLREIASEALAALVLTEVDLKYHRGSVFPARHFGTST